jgi:hypothetical protein
VSLPCDEQTAFVTAPCLLGAGISPIP